MIQEMILSPEELYFLFNECEGAFIDYDYVAMMQDIQLRETVIKENVLASLEEKNAVEEVWGEITVNEDVREFLSPIWNGDFESQILMHEINGEEYALLDHVNIHREGDEYRIVSRCDDGLQIVPADSDRIDEILMSLMPESGQDTSASENSSVDNADSDRSILLKNIYSDGSLAVIEQFFIHDKKICRMTDEKAYTAVAEQEFLDIARATVKGA